MLKKYKRLTYEQRIVLKLMLDKDIPVIEIAQKLGTSRATIYREIKRGNDGTGYSPEYSELQYQNNLREKGKERIVSEHPELAQFIADCILVDKLSPEKVMDSINSDTRFKDISISKTSIYNAIYAGAIPGVTRESLRSDTVRMFSGGTVMIPAWAREEYGFKDGDLFQIKILKDGAIILVQKK